MKWILKIIENQPYKVTCLWNDNIIRTIDLEGFLHAAGKDPANSYSQLLVKTRFSEVKCDGSTLFWENGITMKDIDGKTYPAALDIDPDVLFDMTINTLPGRKKRKRTLV